MIRSCRIPGLLKRICTDDVIQTAIICTTDGELLGSTATSFVGLADPHNPNAPPKMESIESFGTLIADIAVDYQRLGDEYAALDDNNDYNANQHVDHIAAAGATRTSSVTSSSNDSVVAGGGGGGGNGGEGPSSSRHRNTLQCLLLELEFGLVAVSACAGGVDCLVIGISAPNAPLGSVKARLQAMAEYVQEALSPLSDTSYR